MEQIDEMTGEINDENCRSEQEAADFDNKREALRREVNEVIIKLDQLKKKI